MLGFFTPFVMSAIMAGMQATAKPVEEKKGIESTDWTVNWCYILNDDNHTYVRDGKVYYDVCAVQFLDTLEFKSAKALSEWTNADVILTDGTDLYAVYDVWPPFLNDYIAAYKDDIFTELWAHVGHIEVP